jgi:hypothetical protein
MTLQPTVSHVYQVIVIMEELLQQVVPAAIVYPLGLELNVILAILNVLMVL